MTVKKIIEDIRTSLECNYTPEEITQFIYILFAEYMNWPKTQIQLDPDYLIPPEKVNSFSQAVSDLMNNKPVQYITGKTWFNGRQYIVNSDVLIPRPETEELCNLIFLDFEQDRFKEIKILDIGTGSGCVAIDLKFKFPYAYITGIDQSSAALTVAAQNAKLHTADVTFLELNVFDPGLWNQLPVYDIIVSNPPYVLESEMIKMETRVTGYEPHIALFVPDSDPYKFNSAIGRFARMHLSFSGKLFVEINEQFGKETASLFKNFGFDKVEIIKDFFGKDRFVKANALLPIKDLSYWHASDE